MVLEQLLKVKNVNFQLRVYLLNRLVGFQILKCSTLEYGLALD